MRSGDAPVWIVAAPVDMRKSFDGSADVVRTFLGHDRPSGGLLVFRNESSQRVKMMWGDRDGPAIIVRRCCEALLC